MKRYLKVIFVLVFTLSLLFSLATSAAATELILRHSAQFTDYEITKGKMDDVFLAVTGKKLTGGTEK